MMLRLTFIIFTYRFIVALWRTRVVLFNVGPIILCFLIQRPLHSDDLKCEI